MASRSRGGSSSPPRALRQAALIAGCGLGFVSLLRLTWPSGDHLELHQSGGGGRFAVEGHAALSVDEQRVADSSKAGVAPAGGRLARVGLIMLIVNRFPKWWPFLVATYKRNAPQYTLLAVHTAGRYEAPPAVTVDDAHIRYVHIPPEELRSRFVARLGASQSQATAKLATLKGLSDLKPFYGRLFEQEIAEYTHWGWVDWDILLGDMASIVPESLLWETDAVTFPGATLGFAWAGQLTIFQNRGETRELYTVTPDFLSLGFKSTGDGQSGWEERVFLRDVLRAKPQFSINFHMSAQIDYKAQWLTWVPVDHYWHEGRIFRCSSSPFSKSGRPPLLLTNVSRWLRQVEQIQSDPRAFYNSKDRVCLRWDLTSSPWMCCPHSLGVSYLWSDRRLRGRVTPYPEHGTIMREALAAKARKAHSRVRVESMPYGKCQEGAFFHAGLTPSERAPACAGGTWALLDDIGRFSGDLKVLDAGSCTSSGGIPT